VACSFHTRRFSIGDSSFGRPLFDLPVSRLKSQIKIRGPGLTQGGLYEFQKCLQLPLPYNSSKLYTTGPRSTKTWDATESKRQRWPLSFFFPVKLTAAPSKLLA